MKGSTKVLFNGNQCLTPFKKPTEGRNLVTFDSEHVLASGFCWRESIEAIAGKAYLLYQAQGAGHVVAFADDPNFRAMCPEAQRLFLNAVLFGPGH
jgi:hypothetical protein